MERERQFASMLFEYDMRMWGDPTKTDTPWGKPAMFSLGNVFEERDNLEKEVRRLRRLIKKLSRPTLAREA